MRSNYKQLGDYIKEVNIRNSDLQGKTLLGVSIQKVLMPSIANIIDTDMSTYKILRKDQFAYGPVTSRNGDKISVALLTDFEEAMISQAYTSFDIIDKDKLLPEYLMMWFRRLEFDRYARFMSHGSAREIFGWEEMCGVELPIPTIEKQKEIVKEYNVIVNRIKLNEQLNQKLEETAQTIYKQWFVNFEFPDESGNPYKSRGGAMKYIEELDREIPMGWRAGNLNECIVFSNGYGFSSDDLLDTPVEDAYAVFKMGNINRGGGLNPNNTKSWIRKENAKHLDAFLLKKGDLLMCMTDMKENIGLLGNTALMNSDDHFILNQRVGLLRSHNKVGIGSHFLYTLTNSEPFLQDLRSRANLGVQVNLTKDAIISTRILLAPPEINARMQHILACLIGRISTNIDAIEKLTVLENLVLQRISISSQVKA